VSLGAESRTCSPIVCRNRDRSTEHAGRLSSSGQSRITLRTTDLVRSSWVSWPKQGLAAATGGHTAKPSETSVRDSLRRVGTNQPPSEVAKHRSADLRARGSQLFSSAWVVVERRTDAVAEGRSLETVLKKRESSCQSYGVMTRQVGISYVEQEDGEKVCDGAVVGQGGTRQRGVRRRAQPRCRLPAV
jgi:hypothetical protein